MVMIDINTIIVTHVYPPIPLRQFDYSAHLIGMEEEGPVGWGATPEAAIRDLQEKLEEQ